MQRNAIVLGLVFMIALTIRLVCAYGYIGCDREYSFERVKYCDSVKYVTEALSLASGKGFTNTAHVPPGYPVFLSIFFLAGESGVSIVIARTAQCIVSAVLVILVYQCARVAFRRESIAWGSAIIAAVYPFFVFYAPLLLTETVFLTVYMLFIFQVISHSDHVRLRDVAVSGVLFALACLTRPAVLTLIIFMPLYYVVICRNVKKAVVVSVVFGSMFFLTIAPWMMRNYLRFHEIVPITSGSGLNLLNGMNARVLRDPSTTGQYIYTELSEFGAVRDINEFERNRQLTRTVFTYYADLLRDDPARVAVVLWNKCKYFWNPCPRQQSRILRLVSLGSYGLLLPFFIIGCMRGIVRSARENAAHLFCLLVILNSVLVALVYFGNMRYRFPIEAIYIMFAVSGIVSIVDSVIPRYRARMQ